MRLRVLAGQPYALTYAALMLAAPLLVLAAMAGLSAAIVVPVPETFDCSMRWLAYEYGKQLAVGAVVPDAIVTNAGAAVAGIVWIAVLRAGSQCGVCECVVCSRRGPRPEGPRVQHTGGREHVLYRLCYR